MVDSAPATPVPAVDPATVPKVSKVEIAAKAVTGVVTAAAATAWTWATWLTTFAPSINQSIVVVVTALVTFLGTVAGQHYIAPAPHLVIQAADPPKVVPIRVVVEPLDAVKAELASNSAKLDEILKLLNPPKSPAPVVVPGKRTKTSAVR